MTIVRCYISRLLQSYPLSYTVQLLGMIHGGTNRKALKIFKDLIFTYIQFQSQPLYSFHFILHEGRFQPAAAHVTACWSFCLI
jgi:hypothetical protein